jgi:hypothetical protein
MILVGAFNIWWEMSCINGLGVFRRTKIKRLFGAYLSFKLFAQILNPLDYFLRNDLLFPLCKGASGDGESDPVLSAAQPPARRPAL